MEPSTRPTFAETSRHLEFILVGYKVRPEIDEAMITPAPSLHIPHSAEQHSPTSLMGNELDNSTENSGPIMSTNPAPVPSPPAIIVSAETSPPLNFRSAEKRRQSWIAGRYKMFNMATDDLLNNTPSKLKSFFHRALRIQSHFDPGKHKKIKDSTKQKSMSHLKRYNLISSEENGRLPVSGVNSEHTSSGLSDPSSPNAHSRRFLRKKSSEEIMYNFSLAEDSVDGRYSPRQVNANSSTVPLITCGHPLSPNMLEASQSCPSSPSACVCSNPVCNGLDTNRPRCQTTPVVDDLKVHESRRTSSHRECGTTCNNAHSTSQAHTEPEGNHKNQKSSFWIFKRKGNKCKESE